MKFQINRKRHSGGISSSFDGWREWFGGKDERQEIAINTRHATLSSESNLIDNAEDKTSPDTIRLLLYSFLSLGKDRQSLPHPSGGWSVVYWTTRVSISFRPPFSGVVSIKKMLSWAAVQGMRFSGRIRKPIHEIIPKGYFICKKKKDTRYTMLQQY